jgi:hypothetical protein
MNMCLSILKLFMYTDEWLDRDTDFNSHSEGIQWKCVRTTRGREIHTVESLVPQDDEYSAPNSDTASPSETRPSQMNRRMHGP